jgi:hypothetical protein
MDLLMPDAHYFQPELFSFQPESVPVELLDDASLSTVLDMLAVAETVDELAVLDVLTEAEKAQVWTALSDALKQRLQRLQKGETVAPDEERSSLQEKEEVNLDQSPTPISSTPSAEVEWQVGDRVVLKAKPNLTTAELKAIFEVVRIQENLIQVRSFKIGLRRYPTDWLVLYRKAEAMPPDSPDSALF